MTLDEVQAVIDFERKAERARTLEECGDACARVEVEVGPEPDEPAFTRGVREGARKCLRAIAALRSTSGSPAKGEP